MLIKGGGLSGMVTKPGGMCPGGSCPGGTCPGDTCPGRMSYLHIAQYTKYGLRCEGSEDIASERSENRHF